MIRVMLDTDQPLALTNTSTRAPLLGSYADFFSGAGGAGFLAELEKEWPRVVLIDRGLGDPLGKASVIDIERGTHVPGDAAPWYDRQHAAGVRQLTVYCGRNALPAVNHAMGTRSYFRWIATLDGTAHVPPFTPGKAPAAIQCLGAAQLGFHADLSLVWEDRWHPAPAAPAPGNAWVQTALDRTSAATGALDTLHALLAAHQ